MGRDLRGVWDGSLPGFWESRGQSLNPTGRGKLRNGEGGRAGIPQDGEQRAHGARRAAGRSQESQRLASVGLANGCFSGGAGSALWGSACVCHGYL